MQPAEICGQLYLRIIPPYSVINNTVWQVAIKVLIFIHA